MKATCIQIRTSRVKLAPQVQPPPGFCWDALFFAKSKKVHSGKSGWRPKYRSSTSIQCSTIPPSSPPTTGPPHPFLRFQDVAVAVSLAPDKFSLPFFFFFIFVLPFSLSRAVAGRGRTTATILGTMQPQRAHNMAATSPRLSAPVHPHRHDMRLQCGCHVTGWRCPQA